MNDTTKLSSYLDYLPAVFRADGGEEFIGRFLLAFEALLTGLGDNQPAGLEETVGKIHRYFDPQKTDEEFLPWLASWAALSLRADWNAQTKRRFIQEILPLYHKRGTRAGLQRMLEIFTGDYDRQKNNVAIFDEFEQPAHFFQVRVRLAEADPLVLQRQQRIATTIIEQEKPAHTFYALQIATPTMRLVSPELRQREKRETRVEPAPLILFGETTRTNTTPRGNTILGTDLG
ncbi:MAG: phage tail protein [Gammaproteobacteria bacterium]